MVLFIYNTLLKLFIINYLIIYDNNFSNQVQEKDEPQIIEDMSCWKAIK